MDNKEQDYILKRTAFQLTEDVLAFANDPEKAIAKMIDKLSEITGAEVTAIFKCPEGFHDGRTEHVLLGINPKEKIEVAKNKIILDLVNLVHNKRDIIVVTKKDNSDEYEKLSALGFEISLIVPLKFNGVIYGNYLLLGMPSGNNLNLIIRDLEYLNNPLTLLFRYSLMFTSLWELVEDRTKELRETESSLYGTLNSIGDGVISTDLKGFIIHFNPAAEKLTGWTEEESIGKQLGLRFKIINELTREKIENPVEKVLMLGKTVGLTNHTLLITKTGKELLISDNGSPLKNEYGVVTGVVLAFRDRTKERRAEKLLKVSEEKFRVTFNEAIDSILIIEKTENEGPIIREINKAALNNLGYSKYELVDKPLSIIVDETIVKELPDRSAKLLSGEHLRFESNYVRKDGSTFPIEVSANLIHINEKPFVYSIAREITERKIAEKKLKESEARFRALTEQANDAMLIADLNGKIIDVNQKACKSTGYSRAELLERSVFELDNKFDTKDKVIRIWEGLQPGKPIIVEAEHKRKDGSTYPVETSIGLIKLDGKPCILGFSRDITERKKTENELKKLTLAVTQSPAIVEITDKNEILDYVNPILLEITGYTEDILIGQTPRVFKSGLTPPETYTEMWSKLNAGKIWQGIFINRKKSGEIYYESAQIAPIFDDFGEVIYYLKVSQDITKLKKYEDELLVAKEKAESANKLKSEFLAQMSHEIRTPLNTLLSFSSLINEQLKDLLNDDLQFVFNGMTNAGNRIIRTVELIINMSELQTNTYELKISKYNLCSITEEIIGKFKKRAVDKKLDFNFSTNAKNCESYFDEYSVRLIIYWIMQLSTQSKAA